MKTLIIGMGEIGKSLYEILSKTYEVYFKDVEDKEFPENIQMIHICIRYSDDFEKIVSDYVEKYKPKYINICTTVPPGTTRKFGRFAVHSTTRGLHPNLVEGMMAIPKHIGGEASETVASYFKRAGFTCINHYKPETTELAHILNNSAYGINLMFADEMAKLCRLYGVDYFQAVMLYTLTNNGGYENLDHKSKQRMILTPPNGNIGGHCINMSANLIPEDKRTPMLDMLAKYNHKETK